MKRGIRNKRSSRKN